jgi:hypothetical protein
MDGDASALNEQTPQDCFSGIQCVGEGGEKTGKSESMMEMHITA